MTELTDDEIMRRAREIEKRRDYATALEAFSEIRAEYDAPVFLKVRAPATDGRHDRTLLLCPALVDEILDRLGDQYGD